jgi:fused signal recognition particle receptor
MFGALKKAFKSLKKTIVGKEESIEEPEIEHPQEQTKAEPKIEEIIEKTKEQQDEEKEIEKEIENDKIKISTSTKLKSIFSKKYKLSESNLNDLLDKLEISLLQADFSIELVEEFKKDIKEKIEKEGFDKEKEIDESFLDCFLEIVDNKLISNYNEDYFKEHSFEKNGTKSILYIGTNGVGKTTSIAKLGYFLKSINKTVVFAACDTYRAASIEQIEGYANQLSIPLIKGKYGQDPTSIAYDAITYAKSHSIDYVIIDSAGRQDTSEGLMNELKKIKKVINPNLTIFVSESISGQTAYTQANNFEKEIGFDAFVLTKADVDEKGGTLLTIALGLNKPVFYITLGQDYKDLKFFNLEFLRKIIS